jgi:hypothetical protein
MRITLIAFFGSLLITSHSIAQTFTSSNLPIIVIDTHGLTIPDDGKITADLGVINNGEGQTNNLTDAFTDYNGKIGIELRGSSSQFFPKKPYGFELHDEQGAGVSFPLLGMPSEEDWILNATYDDKSLMRDALAYKLGRDLGRYAPRTRYCELIMNGEYQGVYLLVEKIKRDKERVDISKLDDTEISGDNLTGGYILKIDKATGNSGFGFNSTIPPLNRKYDQMINFQYEYPKFDQIPVEQMQYIKSYVRNFELVLKSSSYQDEKNGYRKFIDINSFVDFFIINEVTKNVDGYRLSTYMHKDKDSKGGKLTMGPIWDFNLGFGNADYCEGGYSTGWAYNFNSICGDDGMLVPFWWDRFLSDRGFKDVLAVRWQDLRQGKFSTESVDHYIDSVYTVMNQGAQQRNFEKWPILNEYVWPNYEWEQQQSYDLAVGWFKNWVNMRLDWLDHHMPSIVTGVDIAEQGVAMHVYPNPFNEDEGVVEYEITKPGAVQFAINDLTGRTVSVFSKEHQTPGKYQIKLNQFIFSPGVYFFTLKNEQVKLTAKLVRR